MREVGKVFSLIKKPEEELDEEFMASNILDIRRDGLVQSLEEEGYRLVGFTGASKGYKFLIGENTVEGYEHVGTIETYEVWTIGSERLEKFLKEYEF